VHLVFELLLLDGHMMQFVANREKKRTESDHFFFLRPPKDSETVLKYINSHY